MSTLLCASPRCRPPGRHTTTCQATDKPCRGCLPAKAADGLLLCDHCAQRIGRDAREAAMLWDELGLVLIGAGMGGEIRVSNPQPGLVIRETVVEHRTTIRHTLVSWTLLIAEDRGYTLPADELGEIAVFIATSAVWLGAHGAAGEAADEIAELVTKGRSLRQPSGTRVVEIGPCPQTSDQGDCTGTLRAMLRREASLLPSAVACDANELHTWDSTQWTKLGRTMKVRAA